MDPNAVCIFILLCLFIYFSIDFHKHYSKEFHEAARNPFYRFLGGLIVLYFATINPIIASVMLSVIFFWIADVNLLSTIVL